jgi:Fe-S-cluster containining protein
MASSSARGPGHAGGEWFDRAGAKTGERGLRFGCTMCGNCCTGPEGYVLVSDAEARALAARLKMSVDDFLRRHTRMTREGRSLNEYKTSFGMDCEFLDRKSVPGKAVCGVYEDRPAQCRTWPFWPSIVGSEQGWERARRTCPGIDKGKLVAPEQIRILRDTIKI